MSSRRRCVKVDRSRKALWTVFQFVNVVPRTLMKINHCDSPPTLLSRKIIHGLSLYTIKTY